jgi:hypothetical protein
MRVLAFDLSSKSGAAFDGSDGKPQFSTHKDRMPEDDDFGPMFGRHAQWMRDLIAFQRPEVIAVESPWIPLGDRPKDEDGNAKGRPTSIPIVLMLIGLWAVATTVANAHGIPCRRRQVSTVRKNFTGDGRAKKQDIERRCFLLGWKPLDNHQADAAALWAYEKMQGDRAFVLPPPGLLFANARVTA